jgi:hypothetical protein
MVNGANFSYRDVARRGVGVDPPPPLRSYFYQKCNVYNIEIQSFIRGEMYSVMPNSRCQLDW